MTTHQEFEKMIKKATKQGALSGFYSLGRTAIISAALRAYHESALKNEAQAERAAYLRQVIKNCDDWLKHKLGKTGGNTEARRKVILDLKHEAMLEFKKYPLIQDALDKCARKRGQGPKVGAGAPGPQGPTKLKGFYAHEGTGYRNLKAQGQFVDPGQQRFTPSASLIHGAAGRLGNAAPSFDDNMTFGQFAEVDRLLKSQYKVLYLSKMQRLEYLVAVEAGRFFKATDGSVFSCGPNSVREELGRGRFESQTILYACDTSGNLFVFDANIRDKKKNYVQVNHSTVLAGKEVLCAGTISIKGGYLKGISNLSGHYQPNTGALTKLLEVFRDDEGVSVDNVVVVDLAKEITTSAARYLKGDYTNRPQDRLVLNILNATA
jgi:hypothetical protein